MISLLCLTCALAFSNQPTKTDGPFDYDTTTVAPNVIGYFTKRLNPIVSSNIIAVIGTRSVLVFDGGHHPTITRQIISDIGRRTSKPIEYVVVSHWHDDHWAGDAEFARAFPKVRFIGHAFTGRMMEERREKFRGADCRKDATDQATALRTRIENAAKPGATPVPQVNRDRWDRFLEALDGQLPECDAMEFRPLTDTVATTRTIDLGGRHVDIKFLGRGNTAGDVVAYVRETKTLLTGDLVVAPFPFATQSYISEWSKVLHTMQRMDVTAIVPGHGPVQHDMTYIRDFTEVLESIEQQARASYRAGMTAEELRPTIKLATFADKFSKGDAFIRANFSVQMFSAIDRMWQELSGNWKPEG